MKTQLARIVDYIFLTVALSCLIFLWTRKLLESIWLAVLVSITLGLAITKLIKHKKDKNYTKKRLTHQQKQETEKILLYFFEESEKTTLEFFYQTFSKRFLVAQNPDHLVLKAQIDPTKFDKDRLAEDQIASDNKNIDNTIQKPQPLKHKILVFFDFKSEETTTKEIMKAYSKAKEKNSKLYFFAASFSKKALSLAQTFENIVLFDKTSIYLVLDQFQNFPQITKTPLPNKYKILLKNIVSKEKSKKYFTASLFLMLGSLFLPYSLYYQIFASLCLTLAIVSHFQKESTAPLPFEL